MGKNTPPGKNTPESGCETKAGVHLSPAGCRFWILNEINASPRYAAGHRPMFAALAQHLQMSIGVKRDFMDLKIRGNPTKERSQR
jgi:hypothetical protein